MPGRPRVTVLTGDPGLPDAAKPGNRFNPEDLDTIARMKDALAGLDRYELDFIDRHDGLPERLIADRPEFVLNLCDTGFRNRARFELHVAALLELLDIPHSGASPASMVLTTDKALMRMLAQSLGVPVPDERFFATPEAARAAVADFSYPVLIKPNQTDGSLGITSDAVVRDATAAARYLDMLAGLLPGREVLIQEYLSGSEYGLALIGNPAEGFFVPPPLVVDYSGLPAGLAPILSYESKTIPDSPYWTEIRFKPADLPNATIAALRGHAERLFVRLGCEDYARFDFRADAAGTIKLLEVNTNPAWSYDGKLAIMCGLGGVAYGEMLARIIEAARRRNGLAG
jgi:D-alanine-D-alanine ligase